MEYWSNKTRLFINETIRQTQCLFLVKDTVASLKVILALTSFHFSSWFSETMRLLSVNREVKLQVTHDVRTPFF